MTYDLAIYGIVISILFYEITGISPGGIVVPGYIAIYLNRPDRIITTLVLSLAVLIFVNHLSEYTILYGKRKFATMVMVSFIVKFLFEVIVGKLLISFTFASIGYIVPGLIAKEMDRQGILKTVSSMIIVACLIKIGALIAREGLM